MEHPLIYGGAVSSARPAKNRSRQGTVLEKRIPGRKLHASESKRGLRGQIRQVSCTNACYPSARFEEDR